jgi:mannose-6-phosphate isomerase-like protein (cupin superfamily)
LTLPGPEAVVRQADGTDAFTLRGATVRLVAPGSLTGGRFGLFRYDMSSRSGGPSPHIHRTFAESFFILVGEVEVYDGRDWSIGRPGDYLYVPECGVHAFRNETEAEASMLILFAPGAAREAYFAELAEIVATGRELERAEWLDLWARHDQFPAEQDG